MWRELHFPFQGRKSCLRIIIFHSPGLLTDLQCGLVFYLALNSKFVGNSTATNVDIGTTEKNLRYVFSP